MANINVSTDALVGSLMPTAYIDSIKLETAGGEWPDLRVQNDRLAPHIVEIDKFQKSREAFQPFLSPKKLKIVINVMLKDAIGKDIATSWFASNKFTDFLSYVVVVSTDRNLTDLLLMLDDENSREWLLGSSNEKISNEARTDWGNSLRARLRRGARGTAAVINENTLKAKSGRVNVTSGVEGFAEPYVEVDSKGRETYSFSFSEDFEHNTVEPEHLTVFAYTIFDIDSYFDSLGMEGQIVTRLKDIADKMISPLKVNTVIEDGRIVNQASLLRFVDNNEIYQGPFHTMPNGTLMSGRSHETTSRALYAEAVPNNTVQDFRNFDDFKPNMVDLTELQSNFFPSINRMFNDYVKDSLATTQKDNSFSDIWMTRSLSGECRFAFTMDYQKLCEDNTKYAKILKKDISLLQEYFKIQSFKILRRRISQEDKSPRRNGAQNTTDNPNSKMFSLFDAGEFSKTVGASSPNEITVDIPTEIISTEPDNNNVMRTTQDNGNVRELNLGAHRASGVDLRTYSVADLSVISMARGKYQYGVEIKIKDSLAEYLNRELQGLLSVRNDLFRYFIEADKPVTRKTRNSINVDDPHIKDVKLEKKLGTVPRQLQGNYDVAANRFTQEFVQDQAIRYQGREESTPWFVAGRKLIQVLNLLFDTAPSGLDEAFFTRVCAPESGSPDGISSVISLIDEVAASLAKMLGTQITMKGTKTGTVPPALGGRGGGTPASNGSGSQLTAADPQKNVFVITHYFDNDFFDGSYPKDTGYYYLLRRAASVQSEKQRAATGLRTISVGDFTARAEEDVSKFVKEDTVQASRLDFERIVETTRNLDIASAEKFRFLTPSRISLDGTDGAQANMAELGLPTDDGYDYDLFSAIVAQIANLKSPAAHLFSDIARAGTDSDSIRDNLLEVLADRSCTIEAPTDELRQTAAINRTIARSANLNNPSLPDLTPAENIGDQFGSSNPVTQDIKNEDINDIRNFSEIIGIHTTEDTDLFNAGPVFLRLLMNMVLEGEDISRDPLQTRDRRPTETGMVSIEDFNVQNLRPSQGTALRFLPISIKSLFLSSIPGNRDDLSFVIPEGEDVLKDPLKAMAYYLNFFKNMKLEVLQNFNTFEATVPTRESGIGADFADSTSQTTQKRVVSLKGAVWTPLTEEILNNVGKSDLLIRMRPWESSFVKGQQLPGLNLEVFDTYFVINRTAQSQQLGAIPRTPTAPARQAPIRGAGAAGSVRDTEVNLNTPESATTVPEIIPREYATTNPRTRGASSRAPSRATVARRRSNAETIVEDGSQSDRPARPNRARTSRPSAPSRQDTQTSQRRRATRRVSRNTNRGDNY